MGEVTVRRAGEADAPEVARVQVTGWHEAYTGRMPQSILDSLDLDRSTRWWHAIIAGHEPLDAPGEVWVAECDGMVIGFASAGDSRDEDTAPGERELYAIYVLAEHYGRGAGQALLDAAIGRAAASLWVLEDNPRARAFYERNGFRTDGSAKDDDRWGEPVREVRMARATVD
jgi:ribosomal protein S18 acetylase RimI-like enzyme